MEVKQAINPVFTFETMIASLRRAMATFPDLRVGKNTKYEIADAASGAFSVFFTQSPSFLQHQILLRQKYGLSNARSLFGIISIPSDNHIRDLLDPVDPATLDPVFNYCFQALKENGDLDSFRVELGEKKNDLLIALDGTQYFSSTDISCSNCSSKTKNGEIIYSHSMVTPTIVAPGNNKVISLAPSFIVPQDGDKKQDCELKASKRWLGSKAKQYSQENVTILGDDLYAHEPFCRELTDRSFNFILVCKPDSHKTLYDWLKGITKTKIEDRFDGKKHLIYRYKYIEGVPLKDSKDSLLVNFVEVTVTDRQTKKQLYHNAFITNHKLEGETNKETIKQLGIIIDCGRARWKIENENNNTLKTKGYNLEHNYGHGKSHLSSLLATMNILSFLFHTMLEFMDSKYRLLRKAIGARKRFFEHIRVLLIYVPFKSFSSFMKFMTDGLKKSDELTELDYPI